MRNAAANAIQGIMAEVNRTQRAHFIQGRAALKDGDRLAWSRREKWVRENNEEVWSDIVCVGAHKKSFNISGVS